MLLIGSSGIIKLMWIIIAFAVADKAQLRHQHQDRQNQQGSQDDTGSSPPSQNGDAPVDAFDDGSCNWSWKSWRCEPHENCSFLYQGSDSTLDQNCRLQSNMLQAPQQIHLAFAGKETGTGMTVSWTTSALVNDSSVWIGESPESLIRLKEVPVTQESYYNDKQYALYEHHATVLGLKSNTKYFYRVGSTDHVEFQSAVASFTTARGPGQDDTVAIAIYGDNGRDKRARSTIQLLNSLKDRIDMTYHLGDIAYADNTFFDAREFWGFFYEEAYNQWFNALSPLMSTVPYMVLVGNHEAECHSFACQISNYKKDHLGNYSAFNHRFMMPSEESNGTMNMWYSFDHGPIHFTSISSETDYPGAPTNAYTLTHSNGHFGNQLAWLEQDLKKAQANRDQVPWIFVGLHRPLYSLNECDSDGSLLGVSRSIQTAFEDLLIKYKVDVVLAGHQHWYERHFPIAHNNPIKDGMSLDNTVYRNPRAPVYLVTGAGGNNEGYATHQHGIVDPIPWNVLVVENQFGINLVHGNRSVLQWQFIGSSSQDHQVVDEFMIIQDLG